MRAPISSSWRGARLPNRASMRLMPMAALGARAIGSPAPFNRTTLRSLSRGCLTFAVQLDDGIG